jgi:NAD(P)-dependent dehydrogenase (short-subunit alcohol dehydrogenase family)
MNDQWTSPDLAGQVAVVTGASRGVGRGIAEVLGACGATVYLVARTDCTGGAAAIDATGGQAVAVACDVGDDRAVADLFDQVRAEQGRLDVLVNNAVAWGDHGSDHDTITEPWLMQPPWNAPVWWWDSNFAVGVRSHYAVTNAAAPLFVEGRRGVVVFTSERQPGEAGMQELVLDLRATVVARMAHLYSLHLRPHRVSSILLYPGWSRTEPIEQAFRRGDSSFSGWTDDDFAERTASVHYAGRAVASLTSDATLLERTGGFVTSYEAAVHYGFTDTNGRRPDPT